VAGELRIEAANGASVGLCRACARPFYAPDGARDCGACARSAANVCPSCGYQWDGRGAGVAGDACPLLGCAGRV
jgi:hypothetical protein